MPKIEVSIPDPEAIHKAVTSPFIDKHGKFNYQAWCEQPIEDDPFERMEMELSDTPLDRKLFSREATILELGFSGFRDTWQGVTNRFGSDLVLANQTLSPAPFSRDGVERIKELMFDRGYVGTLKERPWLTPTQKSINRKLFQIIEDDPQALRLCSSPYQSDHMFYHLDFFRGNETVTTVSFNYKRPRSCMSAVGVDLKVNPLFNRPKGLVEYINDNGETVSVSLDPSSNVPWAIQAGEKPEDFYARIIDNRYEEILSIEKKEVFIRNLRYYAAIYQALLNSLYEEAGLNDFSSTIHFQANHLYSV